MKAHVQRLLRHSVVYGGAVLLSKSLVFLMLPLYSRKLTASEYGTYNLLLVTSGLISGVMSLGMGTALVRHAVLDPDRSPRDYYVTTLLWHTLLAIVLLPIAYVVSPHLAGWLARDPAHGDWVFMALALGILTVLALAPNSYLRFEERSTIYSTIRVGQFVLLALLNVLVLVVFDLGIGGLLMSELVVVVATVAVSVWATRDGLRGKFSRSALRVLLRYGLPLVPATFAMIALTQADRFFLNGLGYARELGLYSMAYKFGFILFLIVGAMQTAWPPVMYRAAQEVDAPRRFATLYTWLIAGFVGLGVALATFSPPLAALMTTPEYWEGIRVIPILVLAYVLHAVSTVIGNAIYQSGRTEFMAWAMVGTMVVNLGLNALLIPGHGMMGAAIATLAAYGFLVLANASFAHRVFPVPYEWSRLVRIFAAAGMAWLVFRALGGEVGSVRLWVAAGVGTVIYPVLILVMRIFSREELGSLRMLISRSRADAPTGGASPGPAGGDGGPGDPSGGPSLGSAP
jgi:O-antigen/teichoic acid export membrane protein